MTTENNLLGWREWIVFPELGLPRMKAKVDTGARTSCLHAFEVEPFNRHGEDWVRFRVHPHQGNSEFAMDCEAQVHDQRMVTDSGGHTDERFVIKTRIIVGSWSDNIELTLTARDSMKFRVLLGRTAMKQAGFIVNPALSYQQL
jgi:hypothetical protein